VRKVHSTVVQETTDGPMDSEDDVSIHEKRVEDTPVPPGEQNYLQQELELYRREKELLERESANYCVENEK